jgi:autonomous glycyl radical cofactor GrcA
VVAAAQVFDTNSTGDVDYREFLIGVSKFRLEGDQALKCEYIRGSSFASATDRLIWGEPT